jgi:glycolate dehydrogenase FAD-binding subunit
LTIDGLSVLRVQRPDSIEDLSESLATEEGSVVPVGAATQTYFGNPLQQADLAIDLTRLSRITEYNPADLTIHVQAGVTLAELQHALLEHNQYLPINPWNGPAATIGGITAADAQGPLRPTGTIRDWIIGMKVVHANGQVSKTGGRVVKNVTGYDLARLYTGSIGTLAIIVEISLKLRAKFAKTATAVSRASDVDAAAKLIAAIRKSSLQPISLEWAGSENEVWVRFGEHPKAVEWQLKHLPPAEWKMLEAEEEDAAWENLRERYARLGPVVLRVIGLPSVTREIIVEYQPAAWIAHASNGIVLMSVSDPDVIQHVRSRYRAVIEKAPIDVRRRAATFGLTDTEYELMSKMKQTFDPEGRLNPGRHVDGERHQ